MAGITLAQAQAHLDAWMLADLALATGKAYSIAGRSITRPEVDKALEKWEAKVKSLTRGGLSIKGATPC